jgi:hypothetical protein
LSRRVRARRGLPSGSTAPETARFSSRKPGVPGAEVKGGASLMKSSARASIQAREVFVVAVRSGVTVRPEVVGPRQCLARTS